MSEVGNTEKLIELVRERRLLYDLCHVHNKNRDKKAEAWLEIAAAMGFGNSKVWMAKWKTLRDSYSKFKKNNESSTCQAYKKYKSWPWASLMRFLDDYNMRRITESSSQPLESQNANEPIKDIPNVLVDDVDIPENAANASNEIDISSHRRKKMKMADPSDKIPSYFKPKNEQKSNFDGVDYLFLSYAESFKKFPARMQSMLKLEMATIFARYELLAEESLGASASGMAPQSYASSSSTPNSPWNASSPGDQLPKVYEDVVITPDILEDTPKPAANIELVEGVEEIQSAVKNLNDMEQEALIKNQNQNLEELSSLTEVSVSTLTRIKHERRDQ